MLYVIAGDGTGNKQEIVSSLEDLMAKAVEAEQEFWFAIQPGDSATTKYIVQWFKDKEVYFDSIGAKIAGAAEQRDLADTDDLVSFLAEYGEDGVEFLALFVSVDDDVEEDAALMAQVEAVVGAGVTCRLLNGQMTKISFAEAGDEEVEEETTGTITGEDEDETVEEAAEFTEADLKKMTVPELTAMAKGQGLDVKSIGKGKADLIAAILAQQEAVAEAAEEDETALEAALAGDEDAVYTNGQADAYEVAKQIIRAFGQALIDITN